MSECSWNEIAGDAAQCSSPGWLYWLERGTTVKIPGRGKRTFPPCSPYVDGIDVYTYVYRQGVQAQPHTHRDHTVPNQREVELASTVAGEFGILLTAKWNTPIVTGISASTMGTSTERIAACLVRPTHTLAPGNSRPPLSRCFSIDRSLNVYEGELLKPRHHLLL